jgi:folate-binding protein YgfZ
MTSSVVSRIGRDLVVVSGPDATSFLQSLLSQDLDPVGVGDTTHALLLQPQGKLVVDMRALHLAADEWWCVCEEGFGAELAQGLLRFRIRVKVEIEDRSAAIAAIVVRGADAGASVADLAGNGTTAVAVDWEDAPGVELLGSPAVIDAALATLADAGVTEIDTGAYEALRVEAGVPRQGFDIDESTIAQEAFLERDAVSFTKGCFLGQELVCRIDSRGHVNRLLRRLRADAPLERGDVVVVDGKEVGTVTTAAGTSALAMLRRTLEPASEVVVRAAAGDVAARVEAVAS